MKKLSFLPVFSLVICGFLFSQTGEQVYIVGISRRNNTVYWEGGQRLVLPRKSGDSAAYSITVSGSDVYIAGTDGRDAVYWRNRRRHVLPRTDISASAEANSIAVSGANVYVAGTEDWDAVYWSTGTDTNFQKRVK